MAVEQSYNNSEIVIGLVAAVGVDLGSFRDRLEDHLKAFSYHPNHIRLSRIIENLPLSQKIDKTSEYLRIDTLMTAGNEAREKTKQNDCITALGISEIFPKRRQHNDGEARPLDRYAHIFDSLKHPEEVETLRNVYGPGFFLLGVSSSRKKKTQFLTESKHMSQTEAAKLITRDESEGLAFGQNTREVFQLADGFIDIDSDRWSTQLLRILDLIFASPYITPTKDEYAMFLASASALRSADLSRQVGAVITSEDGEIIATGANDVPSPGGGLYWSDQGEEDQRDFILGYDANEKERDGIALSIIQTFKSGNQEELLTEAKQKLKDTGVFDITEYGRAVHAEMEAIICCARSGVTLKGGTLYCTTYPCHNCAKHIVAAGISRVVYIEPYPKSHAMRLHSDSIIQANENESVGNHKVLFEPFIGVGPRRYIDLFSVNLSSGNIIKRKIDGKIIQWERTSAHIRIQMLPISYLDRENSVLGHANEINNTLNEVK